MGKITKALQPKHRESMSPWLADYVQSATNSPLPLLPRVLEQFPARWPLPRGDMYHWIPLLNRFDNILECFVETYALRGAPQTRDFASEILLQTTPHPIDFRDSNKWDSAELGKLGFKEDADAQLVLAVLKFTRNLLQHCGNRSIYASSAHLSSLLNSSSLHILKASLHVGHELALRYHASYKRTSSTSRAFHSALLQNHYDISLDRVQQLALPFVKTPVSGTSASSGGPFGSGSSVPTLHRTPSTPAPAAASSSSAAAAAAATPVPPSTGKGKEKAHSDSPKAVTTMYSNDFIAIATGGHAGAATTDTATQGPDWSSWGDIKITYYPQHQSRQQDGSGSDQQDSSPGQPQSVHDRTGYSSIPSTPTPLRRTSTMGSQTQDRTPRVPGQILDDASSPITPAQTRTPGNSAGDESAAPSGQRSFELPSRVVQSSTFYELISRCPADMPETARYELLSRIRIAKALLGDEESRQLALAVRLLAITNLAFIHPEAVFLEQVLKQDAEEPRRFQLAYQLAELIRPGAGKTPVPIWLQSIALQLLESLAGFASKTNDIVTAVNATVNHGVLLYVLRKSVADMKDPKPESNEEMILNDDWRKQLFSLTLHLTAGSRMQDIVGAGLMEILVDALKVRSSVAERNYLVVVTFLDTIVLNFPTSFQPFATAHGLDVVSQLLVDTVASAQEAVQKGEITGREMRCSVIDYDIPFYLQQTLKWLLKFIYHLMASSYQFGPENDRLLRNLVDNSQLLQSMRTIIQKSTMFGSVVWTNAATTLSHFINHDPTSFVALSESHLIQSFLESITGQPLPPTATPEASDESTTAQGAGEDGGEGAASSADGNGSAAAPSNDQGNDENGDANDDDDDDEDRDTTLSDESLPDDSESSKPPLSREELARPRDWTLAGGILPSTEVIGSIPSILNSISLNNVGRKMVTTSGALTSYFEIFESPAHVRCMETETGLPSTIGTNFDELARHHPSLRPQITTAVMNMVSRVGYLAEKKAETDAWGLRLLPAPKPTTSTAAAASATESTSTTGTEDVEMADASAAVPAAATADTSSNPQRPAYQDALSFITATSLFLNVYLSNPTLQSLFIKRGGIEILLDLVESPGLPFVQPSAMISPTLLQIFGLLLESSPILAAPAMFSRVIKGLDAIATLVEPYTKAKTVEAKAGEEDATASNDKGKAVEGKTDSSSAFTAFVQTSPSDTTLETTAVGTAQLKALFRVRYLLYLIQSCFPLNRQGTTTMYPLVLFDYYKEFIERLGPLLAFSMAQEAALNAAVPKSWSKTHGPAPETSRNSASSSAGAAGGSSGADAASDSGEPAYAEVLANTAFTQPGTSEEAANSTGAGAGAGAGEASNASSTQPSAPAPPAVDKPTKQEMSSDAYQNYQTMRTLFRSFPSVIVPALQALGKSLLPRRERDPYIRGQHLQLAETLALTILDQLQVLHDKTPATQRHRKFVLEALQDLLVDPTRHSERPDGTSTSYVVVPVLLAFKKHGGFEALNALLRSFADTIISGSRDADDVQNVYFAAIGMKSILDLYAVIVHPKNIQDSTAQVSVFARPTERQYNNQQANQLMIETWVAVLPVVSELWQSPVIEKISSGVLSRLIEIMKTIGSISLEHGYYTRATRPKTSPTDVFGGPTVPFPWSDNENRIARASERDSFAVDLTVESIYRANGNSDMAQEYGHAIAHGLARSRLPVPTADARPPPPAAADPPSAAGDNAGEGSSEAAQTSASADGVDVTVAPVDGGSGERANPAPRLPFSMDVMALDNPRSSEDLLIENLLDPDDEFSLPRIPMPPPLVDTPRLRGSASRSSSSKKDTPDSPVVSDVLCREDVEEKRAALRKDLIDRCLAVIQMHHDSVQDIAELISASVLQAPDLDDESHNSAQQEVGETLVEALVSFAIDDENKKEHAQSIAAYAYLLCLLINDTDSFYDLTVDILRNNIDELLGFLHVPLGGSPDDLPPWLSHIFLLFEILLIKDEQETGVEWTVPTLDSAEIKDLTYVARTKILDDSQRGVLLDSTLDLLPRIGKDDGLAVSASRVLQIMTRKHTVAKIVGEKKNLQRLFLMAKQLSGIGAGGFSDTRLNVYVITTLRHIVEDEDVLRQIMTYEIRHFFENSLTQRSSRHHDLQTFLELFAHVALRNPTLFISVLSDLVKMTRVTNETLQRHSFAISLKESVAGAATDGASKSGAPASHDDSFGPAVQATQELNINDVRPSTETDANAQAESSADGAAKPAAGTADKDMPDAPAKPTEAVVVEHKRPVVENPDGVITFLLEQLMTYQKVDDAETPATKDAAKAPLGSDIPITAAPTPDPAGEAGSSPSTPVPFAPVANNLERDAAASASAAAGAKDKEKEKPGQVFRSSDHPIFVFRAFLISCLSELLRSYSRSKMEFINFKRGVALQTLTPVKPRTSVLNYLLNDILCAGSSGGQTVPPETVVAKKKAALADQARRLLTALVEKTPEKYAARTANIYEFDEDSDLQFVRRFVLDTILKAYKEAASSSEPIDIRYGKMSALGELMSAMIGADKERSALPYAESHSYMQLRRLMYEKGYLAALTHSIADIDLAFPGAKRTLKHVLRVLNVLTATAIMLSRANIISSTASADTIEYDIMSSSSLSDNEDDDREETPDLYRNSSLGMLEGGDPDDEEYSDSEHEDDMYDDEMEYDDEMTDDGEENLSDDDDDEMGPVEGLSGEPGVVELVMDDGDDDDDDDDDEDEDDEEDSDDVGSEDMEDMEDQIEEVIEDLNEDEIMDDDGASEWESEEDDDEGDDDDGYDDGYEVEPAGHLHQVQIIPGDERMSRFDEIVRNLGAAEFGGDDVEIDHYDDPYIEDGVEEEEEDEDDDAMDEEDYIYDQDYPHEDSMLHEDPAGLSWETMVADPHRHHHHHGHGHGHPSLIHRHHRFGADFNIFRNERPGGRQNQNVNEGVNPMLRRSRSNPRDGQRPSAMFRLGIPSNIFTNTDNPMALLNDLMNNLPALGGGRGHPLHFQITQGPHGELREVSMPMPHDVRLHHHSHGPDSRRDPTANTEPAAAIAFRSATTADRWTSEARMVYGPSITDALRPTIYTRILYALVPAGVEEARKERDRKLELERQEAERKERAEKEQKEREAKEAEERARKQAEEEKAAAEAAAAAAAEAAANDNDPDGDDDARGGRDTSEPMEGVETAADADAEGASEAPAAAAAEPEQPQERVMAIIRGAEMDITDLGIDPEYLEALPEEFREEVIAQALTARRSEARQQAETTGELQDENFNAFLDALPDDLRLDIVQQEQQELRRRQREEERRQVGNAAAADNAAQEEMDTASILMSFPPHLRNEILREQGEELFDRLPPEMAAHARSLLEQDQPVVAHRAPRLRDEQGRGHGERANDAAGGAPGRAGEAAGGSNLVVKFERRPVVQMMDRSGVATLLRLMFVTQQGTTRTCLFNLFIDLCQNRQSRLEIISTVLQILQDGSSDMDAVERCFNQLSAKARQPPKDKEKEKDAKTGGAAGSSAVTSTPGTGGSLKRTATSASLAGPIPHTATTHLDSSPLLIVQQGLDLLVDLCSRNQHIPSLFLSEHDFVGASLRKPFGSRKAKGIQSKASRFGINSLLLLLEKDLVMESSSVMQLLAELLNRVTQPLQAIERERRRRELAEEEKRKKEAEAKDAPEDKDSKDAESGEAATSASAADPDAAAAASSSSAAPADTAASTSEAVTAAAAAATDAANAGEGSASASASAPKSTTAVVSTTDKPATKEPELVTPFIPYHNLSLVVNIFVARECSSKTFQNTISTIKNLSCIEGTKQRFGKELARQAKTLSDNILRDLEELLPYIEAAETGTEIQGIALAKFSPGAAEQNKLLRVLTALDHLFGVQAKKAEADKDQGTSTVDEEDYMGSLYHNGTFVKMWGRLSLCLSAIRQRDSMLNVATILLPLIESLMVVCKNANLPESAEAASTQQMSQSITLSGKDNKEKEKEKEETDNMLLLSSPPPESRPQYDLFFRFTEDHRRILNELVRNNPKLMSGTFSLLVKNPKVLEFDNKRNYFNRSVHAKTGTQQQRPVFPPLQLSVRRDQVFHDSFRSLYFKSGDEMKYGKLNIRFHGEEGVDAGGVTREWFQVLSRQMFDPNYALFIPVSSDRTTFHPNKLSGINDEHLMFFKFIGRIIGKALYEGRLLECYFSRAVYKRILGKPVSVKDMESFDPEYYKSLVWMLENDITDVITETFSVVDDEFGATKVVDLIPNGRDVAVTDENKHDYVRLVVEHKLLASVKDQMGEFLKGFHDIIPAELISIFTEQELELLISGLPDIDIDEWRGNTEYHNYSSSAPQIQWFWRAVRSFDKEERAKLLQFVTGTSKVPLNGFKELEGMNGINRFNIHRDYGQKDRLPSSHTCFNQLDLPEYESYDAMRSQLLKAITAGNEYFGFA